MHRQTLCACLVRRQHGTQQTLRLAVRLLQAIDQYHTASLAASSGMHLGFHHPAVAAQ